MITYHFEGSQPCRYLYLTILCNFLQVCEIFLINQSQTFFQLIKCKRKLRNIKKNLSEGNSFRGLLYFLKLMIFLHQHCTHNFPQNETV